jgi:uncharacterized protein YllA (UPF0747 family)
MSVEDVFKSTISELQKLRAIAIERALQEYKKSLQEEMKGVEAKLDELKKEVEARAPFAARRP